MNYRWPGNIRELKNVIRRAALLAEDNEITMKALPLEISNFKAPNHLIIHSIRIHHLLRPRS
jgi:two-component system response regulator HydG